jgi:ribosomal protein S18 acetylase RimI-like enzyme
MTKDDRPVTSRPFTRRPVAPEDDAFLFELYCSRRRDDLAVLGTVVMRMQFVAQCRSYEAQFPTAVHEIILVGDRPAGRVMVAPMEDEVRFVDLALLPEHRNAGIATALIPVLMEDAARLGKSARLHVAKDNKAKRLYERLGFATVGESGPNYVMLWTPVDASPEHGREEPTQ